VAAARGFVQEQVERGFELAAPSAARKYLAVRLGALEHEVFAVVFLDVRTGSSSTRRCFGGLSRRRPSIRAKS
jgi:DNA repair protein RadC